MRLSVGELQLSAYNNRGEIIKYAEKHEHVFRSAVVCYNRLCENKLLFLLFSRPVVQWIVDNRNTPACFADVH